MFPLFECACHIHTRFMYICWPEGHVLKIRAFVPSLPTACRPFVTASRKNRFCWTNWWIVLYVPCLLPAHMVEVVHNTALFKRYIKSTSVQHRE